MWKSRAGKLNYSSSHRTCNYIHPPCNSFGYYLSLRALAAHCHYASVTFLISRKILEISFNYRNLLLAAETRSLSYEVRFSQENKLMRLISINEKIIGKDTCRLWQNLTYK
jgi:hypothetical protein